MDIILSKILTFIKLLTVLQQLFSTWCWSHAPVSFFILTVIFLDACHAIGTIVISPPLPWPRNNRWYPDKMHYIKCYPQNWMIVSFSVIKYSIGVYPCLLVLISLSSTSSRMCCLGELVCLTSEVWWQVSVMKGSVVIIDLLHPSDPIPFNNDVGLSDTTLSDLSEILLILSMVFP